MKRVFGSVILGTLLAIPSFAFIEEVNDAVIKSQTGTVTLTWDVPRRVGTQNQILSEQSKCRAIEAANGILTLGACIYPKSFKEGAFLRKAVFTRSNGQTQELVPVFWKLRMQEIAMYNVFQTKENQSYEATPGTLELHWEGLINKKLEGRMTEQRVPKTRSTPAVKVGSEVYSLLVDFQKEIGTRPITEAYFKANGKTIKLSNDVILGTNDSWTVAHQ